LPSAPTSRRADLVHTHTPHTHPASFSTFSTIWLSTPALTNMIWPFARTTDEHKTPTTRPMPRTHRLIPMPGHHLRSPISPTSVPANSRIHNLQSTCPILPAMPTSITTLRSISTSATVMRSARLLSGRNILITVKPIQLRSLFIPKAHHTSQRNKYSTHDQMITTSTDPHSTTSPHQPSPARKLLNSLPKGLES
jgi:hypothetical protein